MTILFIVLAVIIIFVVLAKSGERAARKALESDRVFSNFDDSIHQEAAQRDRIQRAIEHNLSVKTILSNGYSGKIIGTTGNVYLVTLNRCSCQDFLRRRKPCKHMYFFACKSGRCEICEGAKGFEIYKI